jgi:N-acyl-D-amino-acid deacylase
MTFTLLIRNGQVVDGTGSPWYVADVGIAEGRIVAVGKLPAQAATILDATGKVVCPGFIDVHAHSDLALLSDPDHRPKVNQGITTEILAPDGLGYAPLSPQRLVETVRYLKPINGTVPPGVPPWQTLKEYLAHLDGKVAVNVAYQVPHNVVRLAVMGWEERPAKPDELERMARLAEEIMEQGAVGFATGLSYLPQIHSTLEELVTLSRTVAKYGGVYNTHMRYHMGDRFLDPVRETLEVARQAEIPVHFAHYLISGKSHWGRGHELLALVDAGRTAGLDVTFDSYCYTAGCTAGSYVLPEWANAGGPDSLLARLHDPATAFKIIQEMLEQEEDYYQRMQFSHIGAPGYAAWEGRRLAEVAAELGETPPGLLIRLLKETDLDVTFVFHFGNEADLQHIIRHPAHMGCTDGILVGNVPHPRTYGTYPRYLGRYVRELKILRLEEAIRHFTAFPAQRFGLADRGLLRKGMAADVVVFDPDTVRDLATFENPKQYPEGIEHVIVNGVPVISSGAPTGARPGRVLRRG